MERERAEVHFDRIAGAPRRVPSVLLLMEPYDPDLHAAVVEAAGTLGWDLDDERCGRDFSADLIPDWKPDGVICTTTSDAVSMWARRFDGPLVRLLAGAPPSLRSEPPDELPCVGLGFCRAGEMAADHILSLGLPHLACFRGAPSGGDREAFRAFMAVCEAAGLRPTVLDDSPTPPVHLSRVQRRDELRERLAELPLPCGVMTGNDRAALEVVTAARELGLRVPEDLAVLGMGNRRLIQKRSPVPISSVDLNFPAAGRAAVLMLQEMMDGRALPARHVVISPLRVEARDSTALFICENPGVAQVALRIRRDYAQPLSVSELAREAGLSVRTLQRQYPARVGITIRDDLIRRRLEAAGRMLRETGLKLETIAMESGLGNAKNLCRLFKDHLGTTPGRWRESAAEPVLPPPRHAV